MNELISFLKEAAGKKDNSDSEGFNAYEWSGGNYDDAFYMGIDSGQIQMARDILHKFFPEEISEEYKNG